jgi:undecaprenyl phosphate N,N'-diacetylbacillosamine 1-phosphate transferase
MLRAAAGREGGAVRLYRRFFKRPLDVVVTAAALPLLSPLLAIAALLVKVTSRGRVLFVQERLGLHGRPFNAYKFRTMTDIPRALPDRELLEKTPEVTWVGGLLRRTKLDELPQLLNVLRGDMSLVGPRPALVRDLAGYDDFSRQRLDVRPGLTGLAQVHGNIHLSWPERWQYDVRYVRELSFALDVKIILRTLVLLAVGEQKLVVRPDSEPGKTAERSR